MIKDHSCRCSICGKRQWDTDPTPPPEGWDIVEKLTCGCKPESRIYCEDHMPYAEDRPRFISVCCDRDPCKCGKEDYGPGGKAVLERDYYTKEETEQLIGILKDRIDLKEFEEREFRKALLDCLEKVEAAPTSYSSGTVQIIKVSDLRRKFL